LDSTGKRVLNEYLKNSNPRCFIIIRTPNIPAKQVQWITPLADILFIIHYSLSSEGMYQWITEQLKKNALSFETNVPALIQQYTQGNMLACAQVIEKISLNYSKNSYISNQQALEHVFNQCEHSLFELTENCLLGQADKSIQILRQAANNKTEATLVLWMLTQEIRLLLQLNFLIQQKIDFKTACSQLKIWPQRAGLYQRALKRINYSSLQQLLHYCLATDEQIKSNLNSQMWNSLERITIGLCTGQFGEVCIL
jgi:DNA polymerase III subunit delta